MTTTQTLPSATTVHRSRDLAGQVALVVLGSLLLGGLTSWAQGWLPAELSSFANSLSGWTVCTVALVAAVRPSLPRGAGLGAASFVCLVLGYTAASELRGLTYDPTFWAAVGVLGGPCVGAAAAALRSRRELRVALGSGLLAGVLVADATYGLTVIAGSTSPVYWVLVLVAAGALLVVTAGRRLRSPGAVAVQVATGLAAFLVLHVALAVLAA